LIDRSFLFLTYSCWFQMIWKMDSWLIGLIGRSHPFLIRVDSKYLIRVDSKYFPNFTKSCGQSTSYIRVGGMHTQFLACKSRESIQQAPKSEFKFFGCWFKCFYLFKNLKIFNQHQKFKQWNSSSNKQATGIGNLCKRHPNKNQWWCKSTLGVDH